VFTVLAALAMTADASAATGGATLPGASTSQPAVAPGVPTEPATATSPASTAPALSAPSGPASQVALDALLPPLPILATAARKNDDPVTTDIAALGTPSAIAAIDGHVLVTRSHMSRSELLDLADPASPRVLLSSTRVLGTPHVGQDMSGRAVVVISPCAGSEATVRLGQAPKCPLRAVDLVSGVSRPLPGTTGALAGDLAGPRLVFSRASPRDGVRLYEAVDGAAAQVVDLPSLKTTGDGWTEASGKPIAGTLRATAFDVDPAGRVAVVLEYRAKTPQFSSGFWLRNGAGQWRRLATIGTSFRGLGLRHVLGPRLDADGAVAYVEGVVETPSYVGRWSDDGTQSLKQSIRRSIGRSTILRDTAYDGGRLVFVDWLPGAPCGSEGALACGLRSVGPIIGTPAP
jgi:hypothetical protein